MTATPAPAPDLEPTTRTTVRRAPDRARYDRAFVHAVLDEGLVAHVGIVDDDGQPFVLPMVYARDGERSDPARFRRQPGGPTPRRRRPGLRHGDAARRDRARPLGVPSLAELPLGGRARRGPQDHRRSRADAWLRCAWSNTSRPGGRTRFGRRTTRRAARRCCSNCRSPRSRPRPVPGHRSRTRSISHDPTVGRRHPGLADVRRA